MHISFTAHNTSTSTSSFSLIDYLDKENQAYENVENEIGEIEKIETQKQYEHESFFDGNFSEKNTNQKIGIDEVVNNIDNNRGTQNLKQSNFYMMNVSPSKSELAHMEKLSDTELQKRGLDIKSKNELLNKVYQDQKNELMKMQLKLYAKDLMNEYVNNFQREIYIDESKLPDRKERGILEKDTDVLFREVLEKDGVKYYQSEPQNRKEIAIIGAKTKDYENGKVFSIYSQSLNKEIQVYASNKDYDIINGNRININEPLLKQAIENEEKLKQNYNEKVELKNQDIIKLDKVKFFQELDYVIIQKTIKNIEEPINIYIDKSKCTLDDLGNYQVGEITLKKEIENASINQYKKLYQDEYTQIYDQLKLEYDAKIEAGLKKIEKQIGIISDKPLDNKILEHPKVKTYAKLKKSLIDKELKRLKTQTNVNFKKNLMLKDLIERPPKPLNIDLKDTINIQEFEILQESEKAKLVSFNHDNLKEPLQTWVPKFMLKEQIINGEVKSLEIPNDFIVNKEFELSQQKEQKQIILYDPIEYKTFKEQVKFKAECIEEQLSTKNLKDPVTLRFDKSKLEKIDDKYNVKKGYYQKVLEHEVIKQAKIEYSKDFDKIKKDIEKEYNKSESKQKSNLKQIEKEVNLKFKSFLKEKEILRSNNKIIEIEKEQYNIKASNKKVSEISINDKTLDGQIKIFLPKNEYKIVDGTLIIDSRNAESKIKKATQLYIDNNKLTEISYLKKSNETTKFKGDEQKYAVFEQSVKGINENIKLKFKVSDLQIQNDKYFIEKYKLDYQIKTKTEKLIKDKYGEQREAIYNKLATDKGFNMEKRPLTSNDLLWYGKVETQRTHKPTDKYIIQNQELLKEIEKLSKYKILNQSNINTLESQLIRNEQNIPIQAGMKKDGLQYHVHVVVSRHDKTMEKPENKISLSPLANHKKGKMYQGADVGFNRDSFFQKAEQVFDTKFDYNRLEQESYKSYNELKQEPKKRSVAKNINSKAKGELKSFVKRHTGVNTIKQQISPIQTIKSQLGLAQIPTRIPKSPIDLAYKIGKKIIEKGLGY